VKRTGRSGARLHAVMSLVAVLGLGLCLPSWGFFPIGGFRQFENTPVFARWSLDNLDINRDGDVQGPQDGLLITINTGEDGFTAAEADAIRAGYQTWQDVPGSYMAFRFQEIEGTLPVMGGPSIGTVNDPFNSVTLGDIGGLFTLTFISFVVDPEIPVTNPVTGEQFLVRGPQILEADTIISEGFFRGDPVEPDPENPVTLIPANTTTLQATITFAAGFTSGLSITPLNNIRDDPNDIAPVEESVIPYRGADGIVRRIGATPTMFNTTIATESPDGETVALHWTDLAYDDIAGIMYLYPRIEQRDELFTIAQEARTSARPGFQSSPIVGGHVIAWIDQDRNPTTNRVPLFSTMSGLYNNEQPIGELSGRFQLLGLFKRIVDENGSLFSPDYVITLSPISVPIGTATEISPAALDSMHNFGPLSLRSESDYSTQFPFEVYNEAVNLFNRGNIRNGTPLYFDTVRRQVVSRDSGLTLAQQLSRNTPMFGEESDVCFLDIIGAPGSGGVQQPPGLGALPGIRAFRDNVMLRSRLGAAATDAYYRIAPPIASFLLAHETILAMARSVFAAALWLTVIPAAAWAVALAMLVALLAAFKVRARGARAAAATALALALMLGAGTAEAAITFDTPEQMVQKSDAIIAGEVTAISSYYSTDMLPATIVTDISVAVSDTLKGTINKGSTVTIRVPGGQVGGHVVYSSVHAGLYEGHEVVLLVSSQKKDIGLTLPYGTLGAFIVAGSGDDDSGEKSEEAGEKKLQASSIAGYNYMRQIARSVNDAALKRGVLKSAAEAKPDGFSLDAFAAFVEEVETKAGR